MPCLPSSHPWMGSFSGRCVPLQFIAVCSQGNTLVFDVQTSGRLHISSEDALLDFPFQLVRIVGLVEHGLDSKWYIDPDPLLIALDSWRLWLYGGTPIKFLQWDPREWRWIDADN